MTDDYQKYPSAHVRGKHASTKRTASTRPYQQQVTGKQNIPPLVVPTQRAESGCVESRSISGQKQPSLPASKGKSKSLKRRKGGAWRVVFWVSLVVFVVSVAALGVIAFSYWQGQHTYEQVAEQGFTPPQDIDQTPLEQITVNWDALLAINPDTVGWIYIPGTNINYPIVHTDNDNTYLYRSFTGESDGITNFGSIFLSAQNKPDFSDFNNVIYGHHLNNGSMFSAISQMGTNDSFNAARTVYIFTPQGNYRLTTFSLLHVGANDVVVQTVFASDAERLAYLQDKVDRSEVPAQNIIPVADMTKTFAFATCDNLPTDGRYVLFAYVVESTVSGQSAPAATSAAPAASGSMGQGNTNDEKMAVDDAVKEITS